MQADDLLWGINGLKTHWCELERAPEEDKVPFV